VVNILRTKEHIESNLYAPSCCFYLV
jgi:hypothetical protein